MSEIRELVVKNFQKKYFIMFLTSMLYGLGLFAYFYNFGIIAASILLFLSLFAILKNYLSPKLVLFWYFIFLFAFFNANFRMKNSDNLYSIAPQKGVITGQITSIPERANERTRFFFNVSNINYRGRNEKISGKTFVTIYDD